MFSCFKKKNKVEIISYKDNSETEQDTFNYDQGNSDTNDFYVVTTIFNPCNYSSRYKLYEDFARHMKECNVNLVTIECIFPTIGQTEFQVTHPDNPLNIQIKCSSVYWVKESLINIAARKLPTNAKWICWLDADIQFPVKDWVELTIEQLKKNTIVQVFEKCRFLSPSNEVLREDWSFGYSVVNGKPIDQNRYDEWYPHPGYGWAMDLKSFHAIGGLPEFDIVGSADLHFAFSLIAKVTNAIEATVHPEFRQYIVDWSNRTFQILSREEFGGDGVKVMIGYVPLTIAHNWHGSRSNRQYVDRWKILIKHKFNFNYHMRRNETNGLLEFNENLQNLQKDILDHFDLRNEDSTLVKENTKADKSSSSSSSSENLKVQRKGPEYPPFDPFSLNDILKGIDSTGNDDYESYQEQDQTNSKEDKFQSEGTSNVTTDTCLAGYTYHFNENQQDSGYAVDRYESIETSTAY